MKDRELTPFSTLAEVNWLRKIYGKKDGVKR
jgi:hypothetical protein